MSFVSVFSIHSYYHFLSITKRYGRIESPCLQPYYHYGLCRSSLIMGVHPVCPVCSIVAASLVAVETDVGETISAAKKSHLCVVAGLLELLRSFLQALFPTSTFTSFSSPVLTCWFRVLLHIMRSAARSSLDSVLMSSAFMSLLRTSL